MMSATLRRLNRKRPKLTFLEQETLTQNGPLGYFGFLSSSFLTNRVEGSILFSFAYSVRRKVVSNIAMTHVVTSYKEALLELLASRVPGLKKLY